jgi:hypothetical protein
MALQELSETTNSGRKWHTSSLFRKNPSQKFPSMELTLNHKTWAKALVSGGCVISGKINFQFWDLKSKQ